MPVYMQVSEVARRFRDEFEELDESKPEHTVLTIKSLSSLDCIEQGTALYFLQIARPFVGN